MGRVRQALPDEPSFIRGMEELLNALITGDSSREQTVCRAVASYDASRKMLEEYARNSDRPEELLTILEERQPTTEAYAAEARSRVILRGPGIPANAPPGTWPLYVGPGRSLMTPDYGFFVEPPFDHDDAAKYCLADGKPSFKRVFVQWLAHECTVRQVAEARAALVQAFDPLVLKTIGKYASAGKKRYGKKYRKQITPLLRRTLDGLIDGFDFFFKRYTQAGPRKWAANDLPFRRSGHVTSDFELPISQYLQAKLEEEARQLVGLSTRAYACDRVRGPFWASRHEGSLLLLDDACELLGVSPSQVRRRIRTGHLLAWKLNDFRRHVGVSDATPLVLENHAGERLELVSEKYWIIDDASAKQLLSRRDESGRYRVLPLGRPKKVPRSSSIIGPKKPPGRRAEPPVPRVDPGRVRVVRRDAEGRLID